MNDQVEFDSIDALWNRLHRFSRDDPIVRRVMIVGGLENLSQLHVATWIAVLMTERCHDLENRLIEQLNCQPSRMIRLKPEDV